MKELRTQKSEGDGANGSSNQNGVRFDILFTFRNLSSALSIQKIASMRCIYVKISSQKAEISQKKSENNEINSFSLALLTI